MEDKLQLDEFLPFRLSRLSNTVSAGIGKTYRRQHNMSVTEWRVIAILGRYSDISAREVADKGALDKVAVSRGVNRLISAGLIHRRVAEDDRRRSALTLSANGQRVYAEIAPAAIEYEKRLLEGLTRPELVQLDQLLEKLFITAKTIEQTSE